MPVFRSYHLQLDDERGISLGYEAEENSYLIIAKGKEGTKKLRLSAEAMAVLGALFLANPWEYEGSGKVEALIEEIQSLKRR
jgi:hypothetical protein